MSSRSFPESAAWFLERRGALIVFILGVVLLLPGTGSETGVTTKDEYWLSFRTPLETLAKGDWLTPWVNGEPRLRKPPLLYWAIMTTYGIFGVNPFAARLWGVLAGAGLAACTCLVSRELFNRSGLLSGILLLASIGVAIEGRQAMLDLPLAALSTLALYFAIRWWKTERLLWILASSLALGLSFLVKGPMGICFFILAAFSGLTLFRQWPAIPPRLGHIGAASLLLLLVSLPWPFLMMHLWPNFFQVLGEEASQRRFGRLDLLSPLSAMGGALGLIFPWTLVLVTSIGRTFSNISAGANLKGTWMFLWYVMGILPLFFMQSFERYMLPLMPPMAILCADWMQTASEGGPGWRRSLRIVLKISAVLLLFCIVAISAFFAWFGTGLLPTFICLVLGIVILLSSFPSPHPLRMALATGFLFSALFGWLYPCLGIEAMPGNIQQIVKDHPVGVYAGSEPAMLSVRLGRSVIPLKNNPLPGPHSLAAFNGFVFVESFDASMLEGAAAQYGIGCSKVSAFKTFYSRKTWLRFTRRDATLSHWEKAFKTRSLDGLKTELLIYRVCPQEPCP